MTGLNSTQDMDKRLREELKDNVEALLKDYLRDNLDNWHVKPTPERIEEYLRFHTLGYTREVFAAMFDIYVAAQRAKDKAAVLEALPEKYNATRNVINKMWHDGYDSALDKAHRAIEDVYDN